MKRRHRRVYLADMLDRIAIVEGYVSGVTFEEFVRDQMRRDAVERQIELIGESARQLGRELTDKHPNVPWSKIIGMRNILSHDYLDIELETIWDTATNSLPSLKVWLTEILKAEVD